MAQLISPFHPWRRHFEQNARRPFPTAADFGQRFTPVLQRLLVSSLARFQAGETSEGRLAHQVDTLVTSYADDDFRQCIKLFVKEEARHARILGDLVRALNGEPAPMDHWSRRTFVITRRLAGVRTKLFVALGAEVVGRVFYDLVSDALPPGDVRRQLAELANDELEHLRFHATIWREVNLPEPLFRAAIEMLAASALVACAVDHRTTLAALHIGPNALLRAYREATGELMRGVYSAPGFPRRVLAEPVRDGGHAGLEAARD